MPRQRLPVIGSSQSKTAARPLLCHPHQVSQRKKSQLQISSSSSSSSSSSHPHPGPSAILLSDNTVTPWGGLALAESSFTSIPAPPPPPTPPSTPPAPQPTPCTPYSGRQNEDKAALSSSFNSDVPSPPLTIPESADGRGGGWRARRGVLPQHRVPRPPRLPPLHPVTDLSFSRSFTFSFFELPLHQSPRYRAEHIRNLTLLLRDAHY
uniref:mitogen-activated protein kinase 7 n=1 Tax=Monopterus albus TaxID=43700 RepID=UPI0009B3C81C|nr:mitogen-activated protein kinase 7-like [Monopterus albus]